MKKKKWKEVRSALVMVLVMVAMMSTATYAWFTMTSNPTVTGMQMVASSGTGLSVCNTVAGTYVNAIEIALSAENMNLTSEEAAALADADPSNDPERLRKLVPVSLGTTDNTNPSGFHDPVYNGNGIVTSLDTDALTELAGKVAVYTYYIKSESGNMNVGLIVGNAGQSADSGVNAANQATAEGTFVRTRKDATDSSVAGAEGAIRIGLVVTEANSSGGYDEPDLTDMIIVEPNSDFLIDGVNITSANVELNSGYTTSDYTNAILGSDIVFKEDGTIVTGGSGTATDALFTVSETPKEVTMYVWLEGTDSQCVDQIKTDELEAQIQFTGISDAGATDSNNLLN